MAASNDIDLWNAEAQSFDQAADHGLHAADARAAWRDLLRSLLPPTPARVADLGCGTGTLSVLLADEGYAVDGVDFSSEMVRRAVAKAEGRDGVTFVVADASAPPLEQAAYDAVLCRHVLWAMPDPAAALARWSELLRDGGRLVLVEGRWHTGAGLSADETRALVEDAGFEADVQVLDDPRLWGRTIEDERYAVSSRFAKQRDSGSSLK